MENLFGVLVDWAVWLFDAIGVNLILKKIGKSPYRNENGDSLSDTNRLASPKFPQF